MNDWSKHNINIIVILIILYLTPKKTKANIYNNSFEILLFMTFNQLYVFGDYRGLLMLLGICINYVFYMILKRTSQIINTADTNSIPSLSSQMIFFYIGFQLANIAHNSISEFSYSKTIYLVVLGFMTLFIPKIVSAENLKDGENTTGRILGAMFGAVVGAFYYILVNYKYNVKGEDTYAKNYKICKGGKKYNCQINDYEKIKHDVKQQIKGDPEEIQEIEHGDLIENVQDTCNS